MLVQLDQDPNMGSIPLLKYNIMIQRNGDLDWVKAIFHRKIHSKKKKKKMDLIQMLSSYELILEEFILNGVKKTQTWIVGFSVDQPQLFAWIRSDYW